MDRSDVPEDHGSLSLTTTGDLTPSVINRILGTSLRNGLPIYGNLMWKPRHDAHWSSYHLRRREAVLGVRPLDFRESVKDGREWSLLIHLVRGKERREHLDLKFGFIGRVVVRIFWTQRLSLYVRLMKSSKIKIWYRMCTKLFF